MLIYDSQLLVGYYNNNIKNGKVDKIDNTDSELLYFNNTSAASTHIAATTTATTNKVF